VTHDIDQNTCQVPTFRVTFTETNSNRASVLWTFCKLFDVSIVSVIPQVTFVDQSINQSINLNFYSGLSSKDHC